jgi:type 1 glutamine amidotransferase
MSGNTRRRIARLLLAALCALAATAKGGYSQNAPAAPPPGQGQAGQGQGQAGQRPPAPTGPVDIRMHVPSGPAIGDQFPGQKRIRVLEVAGGCCHDYPVQAAMMMKLLANELPIDWTVMNVGGVNGNVVPALYNDPSWYRGYDLVIHNECFTPADSLVSEQYLSNAAAATKAGVPAIVLHCAMHTFRAEPGDLWRGILGVRSVRHERAATFSVKAAAAGSPILAGVDPSWVTPIDELYVIERTLPGTTPVALGVSPVDGKEYPVVWTHQTGARVFGTTLGHGQDTWNDPNFQKIFVQGVRWALGK